MRKKMIRQYISSGNLEEIEKAVKEKLPQTLNDFGETPLMWAMRFVYVPNGDRVFRLILDQEQDYELKDGNGYTAFSHALSSRRPHQAEMLLEKGVNVNVPCDIAVAPHPRAYAAHKQAFFSSQVMPYPVEMKVNLSPLSLAVYKSYDFLIPKIVESGADLDTVGGLDITALSMAVRADKVDVLEYLLEKGANPNVLPINWKNYGVKPELICPVAIKKALKYGSGTALDLLLKAGSRLPKRFLRRENFYSTPLTYLFSQPSAQLAEPLYCLRQLQKKIDIAACDSDERSALSHAVENNFDDYLIKGLLHEKINNHPDRFFCTPMMYAWHNKDYKVMDLLYNAGVPMASNVYEPTGQTLLMLSLEKKDNQMVSFLLKYNPMVLSQDKQGKTVLNYIDESNLFYQQISELYQAQKKKLNQHIKQKKLID